MVTAGGFEPPTEGGNLLRLTVLFSGQNGV
jgi:hypothetical protein